MFVDLSLPLAGIPEDGAHREREKDLFRLGHYGTHCDRLLKTEIPLEYMKSRAVKLDVSEFSRFRPVLADDIAADLIQPGDFVLLHTGAMGRNPYASKAYLDEFIEVSWECITLLLEKRARFIGLDARGLRRNEEHREADTLCERAGTFVIENLANTGALPEKTPFTLYAAWFDTGGTGVPCRAVAEL